MVPLPRRASIGMDLVDHSFMVQSALQVRKAGSQKGLHRTCTHAQGLLGDTVQPYKQQLHGRGRSPGSVRYSS